MNILVLHQGRTLDELLGDEEKARVEEVLKNNADLTRQTVLARMAQRSAMVDERYGVATVARSGVSIRAAARPLPERFVDEADDFEESNCPACGMKGWLFGALDREELRDVDEGVDPERGPVSREVLEITYTTERFVCSECGLVLDGYEELTIAQIPSDLVHEEAREPDYEPDYGND